jgi:hypothetical protein
MDDNKRDLYESLWWVRQEGPIGGLMTFNADYGYLEAIVRGFRSGFLKSFEYRQLSQCETLDDVKLTMGDTDYVNVLANVNKLTPEIILKRCEDKFVAEFNVSKKTQTVTQTHNRQHTAVTHLSLPGSLSPALSLLLSLTCTVCTAILSFCNLRLQVRCQRFWISSRMRI